MTGVSTDASDRRRDWELFRGVDALWHKTTLTNLKGIISDRQITPNSGQFKPQFSQSRVSYSRHLGGVSLLDFDTMSEDDINEHENKYFGIDAIPAQVFIKIIRSALEPYLLLLPNDLMANVDARLHALPDAIRKARMRVPAIEAIHLGPVPTSAFAGFILAARADNGSRLWQEFDVGALDVLHTTATTWAAEDARQKANRHLCGEYTLAERLERTRSQHSTLTPEEAVQEGRKLRALLKNRD